MIAEAEKQLLKAKGTIEPGKQPSEQNSGGTKENGTTEDGQKPPPRKQKVEPLSPTTPEPQPEVVMRRTRVSSNEDTNTVSNPYRRSRLGEQPDEQQPEAK